MTGVFRRLHIRGELCLHWRPGRALLLPVLVLAGVLSPAALSAGSAQAAGTGPITYAYDTAGRLNSVIDPSSNAATYNYDAAGNITSITRQSSSTVAIMGFAPASGPVGTVVTITGTAFSATPANDTVTFNGKTATVTAAGATQLVVTVPSGATTGAIGVTVSGSGNGTSVTPFTVAATGAPSISGVSVPSGNPANVATSGSTVTITGAGFDPTPSHDVVRFDGTIAQVQSATTTSITATVPPFTGSGMVSVTTPAGTAMGTDFFVPPSPYTAAQVGSVGRFNVGQTQTVNLPTAGHIALLNFQASANQMLSFSLTNSNLSYTVSVYSPDGNVYWGPQGFGSGNNTLCTGGCNVPVSGAYTILIDPGTNSGSVGVMVNDFHEVVDPITPSTSWPGNPVNVTISAPGQAAFLTFTGHAGDSVSALMSNSNLNGNWQLVSHDDSVLASQGFGGGTNFMDRTTLPVSGSYTIAISGNSGQTGSFTVTLFQITDVQKPIVESTSFPGNLYTVTTTIPGQDAWLSFAGTAGQEVDVEFQSSNNDYQGVLSAPDGSWLASQRFLSGHSGFDGATLRLNQTGTWAIGIVHHGANTGSITVAVYRVTDIHTTITPNGPPVPIALAVPGQSAYLSFSSSGDNAVTASFTSSTIQQYDAQVREWNPPGGILADQTFGTGNNAITNVSLTGHNTFAVVINHSSDNTGRVTVTLTESATQQPKPLAVVQGSRFKVQGSTAEVHSSRFNVQSPERVGQGPTPSLQAHAAFRATSGWPGMAAKRQAKKSLQEYGTLVGKVYDDNGTPLAYVNLSIGGVHALTSRWGDFELRHVSAGHAVLLVQGRTADRPGVSYGLFEIRVHVPANGVAALPYIIWMARLDTAHTITIPSPTRRRTVLATPHIPGLKIILPEGAVIRDVHGHIVHRLTITRIPTYRPPFPTPHGVHFPVYFTVQPGDAVVTPARVQVIYPNADDSPPGTRMPFWGYEPHHGGWWIYGYGTVTKDRKSLVPDHNVRFSSFSGAGSCCDGNTHPPCGSCACKVGSTSGSDGASGAGSNSPSPGNCTAGGPVDLSSGYETYHVTDLTIPDVIPIHIGRSYISGDPGHRFFGIGTSMDDGNMELFPTTKWQQVTLGLPTGANVVLNRVSPGTGQYDAVYTSTATDGPFYGARLSWGAGQDSTAPPQDWFGGNWYLKMPNGTDYLFSDFGYDGPNAVLEAVQDRNGNMLRLIWSGPFAQPLGGIKSPGGHWVQFSYNGWSVSQVQDDAGRTVSYSYDTGQAGHLLSVTDANGNVTNYGYTNGLLTSISDGRGVTYETDTYNSSGQVTQQTLGDGGIYRFFYNVWGGPTTDVIYPGGTGGPDGTESDCGQENTYTGNGRFITLNSSGQAVGDGFGTLVVKTNAHSGVGCGTISYPSPSASYSFTYQDPSNAPGSGVGGGPLLSETDGLNRQTTYTYDKLGDVLSMTRLAGTSSPNTTSAAYNSFGEPLAVTDPAGHKTTYAYDAKGNLTSVTDARGHTWVLTYNSFGEPLTLTDPLSHTTTYAYDPFGQPISVTDALNRQRSQFVDAAGRVILETDPLGNTTTLAYDPNDNLLNVTDPLGHATAFTYDQDNNLSSVKDPNDNITYYTYDAMDRLCAVTDPLAGLTSGPTSCPTGATSHTTVYFHDGNGNLTKTIDARDQATTYAYDALNRLGTITYNDRSTDTNTWDAGNRLVKAVDSVAGTITRTYDSLDNLTSETDPIGTPSVSCNGQTVSICYTYDADSNRTGMTVSGQSPIAYTYDADNNLTSATQGTGTIGNCNGLSTPVSICLTYNNANLQTSTTLANTVSELYNYDQANQLIGITYATGSGATSCNGYSVATCLGYLNYGYDLDGQRTTVGGPWARTNIPAALGSATYNAANELCWTSISASSNGCGSAPSGATHYAYDANGNLTSDGTNTYTWNARNQLASISGGATASFSYDPFGRRLGRTVGSATTGYLYDGLNPVQELNGTSSSATPTANMLTGLGLDQTFTRTSGAATSSLLTDALGSTVALTNSSGTVATTYTYDPYGNTTSGGTASSNPAQFAGMANDGTLYFDNARYYSPGQGRFLSQDPLGPKGGSADAYQYAFDEPAMLADRSGLACGCPPWYTVFGSVAGAVGTVGATISSYFTWVANAAKLTQVIYAAPEVVVTEAGITAESYAAATAGSAAAIAAEAIATASAVTLGFAVVGSVAAVALAGYLVYNYYKNC